MSYTSKTSPCIIAIGGASCSGKTSIATALTSALPGSVLLSLDSYYCDLRHLSEGKRAKTNFDAPAALDWPLVRLHVEALARGHAVRVPQYDFVHHLRLKETVSVRGKSYVILEGLFALYDPQVRDCCALTVFVDALPERVLERRLDRDVRERGRTPESVTRQYAAHVQPMAERYVLPTRKYADLILDGSAPPADSAQRILDHLSSQ